ncbi:MAG: CBS domain-containing protein [Alphaproteobacteria bacterium]|jgi:CBS domain containing-hemolysin-like protein|nr:CBS domain-containing protein [Alphaproteobacteria bacterium]MCV6599489.1 CBS domain-containing protein [Alphaproteobacteria bacterium]
MITKNTIKEEVDSSVNQNELLIIDNVLDLKNLKAIDIMIPRADIVGIDKNESHRKVLEKVKRNPHFIYPVYKDSLDEILGMVRLNELLIHMIHTKKLKITDVMIDCVFISPAMPVLDLLLKMRTENIKTALVVDEFGGIDGLISAADIMEEIVGEIKGVSNQDVMQGINRHKNGTITLDARIELEDLQKEIGIILTDDDDIDTVGGVIVDEIGRIPVKGELISLNSGVVFEILEANPRTIKTVKIKEIITEEE